MTDVNVVEQGLAEVNPVASGWNLNVPQTGASTYSNAMITSYRSRKDFAFRAHTQMELTAYAEGELSGTAGFGFWNHPYGLGMRLPRAVWFFFSSHPSDMPLAMDVSGRGFKAAVFDAQRWLFYALLPAAPVGMLLMRIPAVYKRLWPLGQRAIGVDEAILDAALLQTPRRYAIDWQSNYVKFTIDGTSVFETHRVPGGPLGFVAWIDNQYAIVTPQGKFRFGLVNTLSPQTLVIENLSLATS
jgi:hypothetical protein